jgi:hypothetical protein
VVVRSATVGDAELLGLGNGAGLDDQRAQRVKIVAHVSLLPFPITPELRHFLHLVGWRSCAPRVQSRIKQFMKNNLHKN